MGGLFDCPPPFHTRHAASLERRRRRGRGTPHAGFLLPMRLSTTCTTESMYQYQRALPSAMLQSHSNILSTTVHLERKWGLKSGRFFFSRTRRSSPVIFFWCKLQGVFCAPFNLLLHTSYGNGEIKSPILQRQSKMKVKIVCDFFLKSSLPRFLMLHTCFHMRKRASKTLFRVFSHSFRQNQLHNGIISAPPLSTQEHKTVKTTIDSCLA